MNRSSKYTVIKTVISINKMLLRYQMQVQMQFH